ncbi:MAG: diacylglycerol kinase family lipid kinase [Duncaniella sp.]|nr:diacylglycerol kinase family lipid kinase [Duncaniella sp.]MDE5919271.1 diacylglycerol kinase family lipid kinase [Duncaniella sp.]MDE6328337.1 diacylglycerol kinase family lipid kinase [Duncaniella sp.]MDE6465998.1 diacylglycerol kinase family lipid kinase [Duncaniella sp.]
MKARLIINPISGTHSKAGLAANVVDSLSPLGWDVETVHTRCSGDATRLALEAVAAGYDAVLAAGGDGTVNETAIALCGSETALGILPCGSGNGLARHLGIPVDAREGLKIIMSETPRHIDYATVNDRKFFCTFGVGFDAAVSDAFARKKSRGKLKYIQSTFETYAHYEPELYRITANGKTMTEKAFLIAVCNASQYGNNAYIAPSASIDDGMLDVTVVHAGNPFSTALVGFDLLAGMIEHNVLIRQFRTSALTIERTMKGIAHIDGEPVEMPSRLEFACHPSLLKVFAPKSEKEIKPFITPAASMLADFKLAVNRVFQKD